MAGGGSCVTWRRRRLLAERAYSPTKGDAVDAGAVAECSLSARGCSETCAPLEREERGQAEKGACEGWRGFGHFLLKGGCPLGWGVIVAAISQGNWRGLPRGWPTPPEFLRMRLRIKGPGVPSRPSYFQVLLPGRAPRRTLAVITVPSAWVTSSCSRRASGSPGSATRTCAGTRIGVGRRVAHASRSLISCNFLRPVHLVRTWSRRLNILPACRGSLTTGPKPAGSIRGCA